jgi:hypothetical protein
MAITTAEKSKILFEEDFSKFKIGDFPYDNDHTAIGEYHYFAPEGYYGGWYDPVVNYRYCGTGPSWIVTENSGRHYMESMRIEKIMTELDNATTAENENAKQTLRVHGLDVVS